MIELDTIYNKDCIEGMKELHDSCVNLVLTSPPYNIGKTLTHGKKSVDIGYDDTRDDYFGFLCNAIDEMIRVSKQYVFLNIQPLANNKTDIYRIFGKYAYKIKEVIIWHKKRSPPQINSSCLRPNFEYIICFDKKTPEKRAFDGIDFGHKGLHKTCWDGQINDLFYNENFDSKNHHAIFPIWLPRRIIELFSKENDVVLDPFMGCGTTAVACKQLNRRYIGFEIDKSHYDVAVKRLDGAPERVSDWFD